MQNRIPKNSRFNTIFLHVFAVALLATGCAQKDSNKEINAVSKNGQVQFPAPKNTAGAIPYTNASAITSNHWELIKGTYTGDIRLNKDDQNEIKSYSMVVGQQDFNGAPYGSIDLTIDGIETPIRALLGYGGTLLDFQSGIQYYYFATNLISREDLGYNEFTIEFVPGLTTNVTGGTSVNSQLNLQRTDLRVMDCGLLSGTGCQTLSDEFQFISLNR